MQNLIVIEASLWNTLMTKIDDLSNQVKELIKDRTQPDHMTPREAAAYLGYTAMGLHNLKKTRQIPYSQHGKKITYRREDLDAFLAEHRINRRRPEGK
jgi:excisionase family DNA binding protein